MNIFSMIEWSDIKLSDIERLRELPPTSAWKWSDHLIDSSVSVLLQAIPETPDTLVFHRCLNAMVQYRQGDMSKQIFLDLLSSYSYQEPLYILNQVLHLNYAPFLWVLGPHTPAAWSSGSYNVIYIIEWAASAHVAAGAAACLSDAREQFRDWLMQSIAGELT